METSGMVIPEVYIRWTEERVDDQKKEVRIWLKFDLQN